MLEPWIAVVSGHWCNKEAHHLGGLFFSHVSSALQISRELCSLSPHSGANVFRAAIISNITVAMTKGERFRAPCPGNKRQLSSLPLIAYLPDQSREPTHPQGGQEIQVHLYTKERERDILVERH